MKTLTPRQQEILDLISSHIAKTGFPPTRMDICNALGFKSPNAAEEHLRALERKGAISLSSGTSRGIRLLHQAPKKSFVDTTTIGIPLIGRVAAGQPMLAQEHIEAHYSVDPGLFAQTPDYFLKVRGMSMRDAGILEDDLLAVKKISAATQIRNGQIVVDDWSQTAVPSIFAVGDVTDRVNLTPVAIREGHAFADTVFRGIPTRFDHDLIPSAVFTQPELGSVGLSEEQARDQEPIEVYTATFRPMKTLFAGRQDRVLMKLIVSIATRKVLGCHIVAPEAGELIQLAAIAIRMGATKEDFDRTVAVHPTMAEELVTMRKPNRKA